MTKQIRRIFKDFRVILCVDANARLTVASETGDVASAFPEGHSAELFKDLLHSESLQANDLLDVEGKPVVTWVSPNGHESCIDYVAVSVDIAHGLRTIGEMANFSDCFDFDHRPLQVDLSWATDAEIRAPAPGLIGRPRKPIGARPSLQRSLNRLHFHLGLLQQMSM